MAKEIMNKPTVVILSAGESSRMAPLNSDHHKSFLQLSGKSLIGHTIDNLSQHEYQDIILITPPDKDNEDFHQLAEHSPVNIQIVVQKQAKGMGNALLQAESLLPDKFFVIFPYHTQIGSLLDLLLKTGEDTAITSVQTDRPEDYGMLKIKNNRAVDLIEKPESGTEPSNKKIQGAYLLNRKFIELLKETDETEYNFEKALAQLMQQNPIRLIELERELPSLKYPWQLFDFQKIFFQSRESNISSEAQISSTAIIDQTKGPVVIEKGATIGDFVKVVGPCYIGENALIGDYSFIRHSNIEASAVIGAKTEIVRSIFMPGASTHFSYLADSIIDTDAKIGAGLITANKRLDRKNIKVEIKGKEIDTHTIHLGVIIGARANLGIGVRTMPGVFIQAESKVMPGEVVYQKEKE